MKIITNMAEEVV